MSHENFNHPFPHPYNVQIQLMSAIYKTLVGNYKIGLFESPTGTGKTLSLICSTMTWLREKKKEINEGTIKEKLAEDAEEDEEPEWVKKAYRDKVIDEYLTQAKLYEKHLQDVKEQGTSILIEEKDKGKVTHYKKRKKEVKHDAEENWDDLLPDNYELSDNKSKNSLGMDKDLVAMMDKLDRSSNFKSQIKASLINESKIKIYFVSRTHSQLSQFSSQLKMTQFPSSIDDSTQERIKYLPLGSRKQLCINDDVSSLGDLSAINEKCKDLQQSKENKCSFMPKFQDEEDSIRSQQLNDIVMSDIYDIEDLNRLGAKIKMCPYYATKRDIPLAEIISMPYQLLLHKDTRQYLGLDLKDSIVIIDEAHNLIDTITRIYSSSITIRELSLVRRGLKSYMKKFMLKMSVGNRVNLSKLMKLITGLYKFMQNRVDTGHIELGQEVNREDIFEIDSSDLLNVYTLEDYFNKSKIAFKLESYMGKVIKSSEEPYQPSLQSPLLFKIRSFIYSLSNPLKSGKFFFDKVDSDVVLKYLLLDPSEDFKDIVQDAKCVLLAGGTMEPITDFTDFLVPQISKDQILSFSCNHVIPDENLSVFPIAKWKNVNFEFTFKYRNDERLINGVGDALLELLAPVPDGAVVFFPSYSYLDQIVSHWKKTGLYNKLASMKPIFMETKNCSVDGVLNEYKHSIQIEKKGALLLSVVGGKMSEGINFNDEMARAVVMVGMPYPNAFSGDLIAKRDFIEQSYHEKGFNLEEARAKGREFYENLCMKAVNQSVGRAIRNINDYAVIYLIDSRYSSDRVRTRLSNWIQKRIVGVNLDTEFSCNEVKSFFRKNRSP